MYQKWTTDEEQLLIRIYPQATWDELRAAFPTRSRQSIRNKAYFAMHLHRQAHDDEMQRNHRLALKRREQNYLEDTRRVYLLGLPPKHGYKQVRAVPDSRVMARRKARYVLRHYYGYITAYRQDSTTIYYDSHTRRSADTEARYATLYRFRYEPLPEQYASDDINATRSLFYKQQNT